MPLRSGLAREGSSLRANTYASSSKRCTDWATLTLLGFLSSKR